MSENENEVSVTLEDVELITKPEVDNRVEVRVRFKKCLQCNYLVEWKDKIGDCNEEAYCPAKMFRFEKGLDPQKYMEDMASLVSDALISDDKEATNKAISQITESNPDFLHRILSFASDNVELHHEEQARLREEKNLEQEVTNVEV